MRFLNETLNVEFKRSGLFADLQFQIAKTAQAISNLQDGGLIIIGVSQIDGHFVAEGIQPEHAESFKAEAVYDFVNMYASPPIELRIITVTFDEKPYVAIVIPPFERFPVVCRKNTPDGAARPMREGEVYVRVSPPVKTTRLTSAPMMDELLQRAAAFRAAETLRILSAGGIKIETLFPADPLRKEIEDLGDFL